MATAGAPPSNSALYSHAANRGTEKEPTSIASAADTETPVLTSFSVRATQVTPGQQVTFSYVASEGSGSLSRLKLQYYDSYGHPGTFTFDGPLNESGSVTVTVPDTWLNGLHKLSSIELTDPSGNRVHYAGDGSTSISPVGATGPSSHTLLLAAGNLTVSGSTVDMTIPSLKTVSVTGSPTGPDQTISVHYEATDAAGSLRIAFWFLDAFGAQHVIEPSSTEQLPLSGVVDQVIPTSWPNGTYLLKTVVVTDAHGNRGTYASTGKVALYPAGAEGSPTHTVDFGAATFTVSGSTADYTPPVLNSVRITGSPMLPTGSATLSYAVESRDPVKSVSFTYRAPWRHDCLPDGDGAAHRQPAGHRATRQPHRRIHPAGREPAGLLREQHHLPP